MTDDEEFQEKLRAMFTVEAGEHLQTISDGLLVMEKKVDLKEEPETLETVYRAVHSLKGASRAAGFSDIEIVCQAAESVFYAWKSGKTIPGPSSFDIIYSVLDGIRQSISAPEEHPFLADELTDRLQPLINGINLGEPASDGQIDSPFAYPENGQDGKPEPPARPTPESYRREETSPKTPSAEMSVDSVRIEISKLDSLLLKAEQMLTVKLRTGQRTSDLAEVLGSFSDWQKEWSHIQSLPDMTSIAKNIDRVEGYAETNAKHQILQFLNWNASFIKRLEKRLTAATNAASTDHQTIGDLVDDLLGDAKKVLMLPLSVMLRVFPRMVRDISCEQGKEVDLEFHGEGVEIDKRILEELQDPIIHLIRNAIDHGIEKTGDRERIGKQLRGKVTISACQVGSNRVEIVVSDDGRGIDLEKVREKVVGEGLVTASDFGDMGEAERISLIFCSGVSTNAIITEVSGRGLGLAIVQEKAEKLGGSVSVETKAGEGTTFRFLLPLTLATFRAVIVESAGRVFAIPSASVERVTRVTKKDIRTMENRESVVMDDAPLSVVRLADLLGLPCTAGEENADVWLTLVVIMASGAQIAFLVDAVCAEQEILMKSLGRQLKRVRNIGGATVLGSGKVIPILNVQDLVETAVQKSSAHSKPSSSVQDTLKARSVLVAEDSITSRTLLRSILESAGYSVTTAIDGMEALTTLKTGNFDALVSDVEMPRMDGFELTRRVRENVRLKDLPVVLVTARESQEDRERGVETGASAYIVKSSFDQSNLLEVLGRLI